VGEACTAWLPAKAFADGVAARRLAAAVEAWAERWFADRRVAPLADPAAARAAVWRAEAAQVQSLDDGLAVAVGDAGRLAIAGAMLDAAIDVRKARPADRQLFDRLSDACLDDLRTRMAQAFKLAPDARWRAGDSVDDLPPADAHAFGFDDADEPLLLLFVTRDLEVALIKSGLRAPPSPPALAPLATGLAAQTVDLSALLGRCDLTVAELAELTCGDVLVLDRDLDAPLDLAIDGRLKSGRCSVAPDGDRLHLTIVQTPTGN